MLRKLFFLVTIMALAACSPIEVKNPYADAFTSESIRSILIVPALNRSVNVEAPWVLLATLPEMLAEAGYYVFPVNTVKVVLEHEGLYEAAAVHEMEPTELANMFEADSVLYITIKDWETRYEFVKTSTQINLSYRLVSRSGVELWSADKQVSRTSAAEDPKGGFLEALIVNAVGAVIQKATVNYRPLAQESNQEVFVSGATKLPDGPYLIQSQEKN